MNIKIYTRDKKDSNDAVTYYLQIFKQALEEKYGREIEQVFSVKEVQHDDIVFVISPAAYFYVLMKNPRQKVVYWFQGIFAEEVAYLFPQKEGKLKVWLFTWLERRILNRALLVLFVSEAMLAYYRAKFGYNKANYVIMPCFNKQKDISIRQILQTDRHKYDEPSFVYVGSVNRWQCIDETVYLFSLIKKRIPDATLTILTGDQKDAEAILAKYGVSADVKYVPLVRLDEELRKYKYGFILRRDIPLNRVSTPTKLSSYLANGLIPIYSSVIESFDQYLGDKRYAIPADINSLDKLCEEICRFDKEPVDIDAIEQEYDAVFATFYNESGYKRELLDAFGKYLG